MLCLFRSRISNAGTLSSNVLRIHARRPIHSNISLLRGYATRRPPPPPKSPPLPSRSKVLTSRRIPSTLPLRTSGADSILRKIETAERLFKADDKILYKSTSRTTFFRVYSWIFTGLAGVLVTLFYSTDLLDLAKLRQLKHEYANWIFIAFVISSVGLGAAGAWMLKKSWNHIHRLDLVRQSTGIFLQVTCRSGIPFVKRSFVIQPHDLIVDARWTAVTNLPEILVPSAPSESSPSAFTAGVIRETLKSVSRLFYSIFDNFRVFFNEEGLIKVDVVREKKGEKRKDKYYMDAAGLYLMNNKNQIVLWDVVEILDPHNPS